MSMTPYYEQDGITIFHGDCREILPILKGDSIVTDPPYGIGWDRATWTDAVERIHAMLVAENRSPALFGGEHVKRTERKSFFRRLAEKNGSPRIDHEEILVMRKA